MAGGLVLFLLGVSLFADVELLGKRVNIITAVVSRRDGFAH